MKKTEKNNLTVDQENRIIRQCNHVKKYRSNGRLRGSGVPERQYDKRNAGE